MMVSAWICWRRVLCSARDFVTGLRFTGVQIFDRYVLCVTRGAKPHLLMTELSAVWYLNWTSKFQVESQAQKARDAFTCLLSLKLRSLADTFSGWWMPTLTCWHHEFSLSNNHRFCCQALCHVLQLVWWSVSHIFAQTTFNPHIDCVRRGPHEAVCTCIWAVRSHHEQRKWVILPSCNHVHRCQQQNTSWQLCCIA